MVSWCMVVDYVEQGRIETMVSWCMVVDYVENSKGFLSRKLERHETLIKGWDLQSKIKSF